MSSVDLAVQAFRELKPEDFKVLSTIEANMSRFRYVPGNIVSSSSGLPGKDVEFRLGRLNGFGLIFRWVGSYNGYVLSTAGYDCLAINALVKANVIEALGKSLGVGKESDVYGVLTPHGEKAAAKFHRLGRTSFRKTRRLRTYVGERRHAPWLLQSRLAAEKEFEGLKMVHRYGVAVPKPISQNRHVLVMGMIEGNELTEFAEIPQPEKVLEEILFNIRKAYLDSGIVHGDLSEFNIILKPDNHILIIDWPQYVRKDHPSAEDLLKRDVRNVLHFFDRKFKVGIELDDALRFVKGG